MGNPVVHFEVIGDAKILQSFYAKQFGWSVNAKNAMQYGLVDTKASSPAIGGGIGGAPPGAPPTCVTFYIEVPNIDKALAKINAAGGKTVTPKMVIPDMVTLAHFADPSGNMIGLVEPMPTAAPKAAKAKPKAKAKSKPKAKAKKPAPKKKARARK